MARCGDGHVGAQHGMIPNIDMGVIHQCQIKISINSFSKMYMAAAEIRAQGRFYIAPFPDFSKHLLQHSCPLFPFCRPGHIKIIETVKPPGLLLHDFRITREIKLPCVQPVFHFAHLYLPPFLFLRINGKSEAVFLCFPDIIIHVKHPGANRIFY